MEYFSKKSQRITLPNYLNYTHSNPEIIIDIKYRNLNRIIQCHTESMATAEATVKQKYDKINSCFIFFEYPLSSDSRGL